jgi:hypothetical protein
MTQPRRTTGRTQQAKQPAKQENPRVTTTPLEKNKMSWKIEMELPAGGKISVNASNNIDLLAAYTGTQRINTGIKGSSNLRVVDVIQNTISTDTPLFGSRAGMNNQSWCYWQQVGSQVLTDCNTTGYSVARSNAPFNQRLIIDKDKNVTKVNGTVIHTASAASFSNTIDLYLGNVGTAAQHANNFNGTMYSCKIYDNDVLVRDFVPVPQDNTKYSSSPAPSNCMWDKVTQQYFENAGTGNFGIIET